MFKLILVIIASALTIILYLILGIQDFKPNKKQLFALIPLLLILFTLSRMDLMFVPIAEIKHEEPTKEEPTQAEIAPVVEEVFEPVIIHKTEKEEIAVQEVIQQEVVTNVTEIEEIHRPKLTPKLLDGKDILTMLLLAIPVMNPQFSY